MHGEPEYLSDPGLAEPPLDYRPPPPSGAADKVARLRLYRSRRVGPATYLRLMAEHGSAEAAIAALPAIASAAGVARYAPCPEAEARSEIAAGQRMGARLLCLGGPDYPETLASLPDAPPLLWALGKTDLAGRPAIAVIGTRNASSLGARMARRLAADLGAAGYAVVSGLARGIDAIAHEAAFETGTISVEAGGLDRPYPSENAELAARIGRTGLRLSEQPFGLAPAARHFPQRNRIVAGLALAVVVVEAAARSGSLITARMALEAGREVLAVPGHPMDSRASGCNHLIRDGATLIRGADDVLEHLGTPPSAAEPDPAPHRTDAMPDAPPGAIAADLLARLGPTPTAEDQLIQDIGAPPAEVARVLTDLELEGRVIRHPGAFFSRAVDGKQTPQVRTSRAPVD